MSGTDEDSTRAREISPVGVRMPPALRLRVSEAASANNRSLSAEIVARLEQSFEQADEWANALENIDDALSRIEALEREMLGVQEALKYGLR